MEYLITLLEGIISFISPCTLPLLPVYLAYLAGGRSGESLAGTAAADHMAGAAGISGTAAADRQPSARRHTAWTRPLGFVLGFTVVFCLLGLFAGVLSMLLVRHQSLVNAVDRKGDEIYGYEINNEDLFYRHFPISPGSDF